MNTTDKLPRPLALGVAAFVVLVTSAVLVNATQTLTVPNAAVTSYVLAPGANSAAIFPPVNRPALVMGVCTTVGVRGVGHVTLLRTFTDPKFIEWTGVESPAGAALTSGFSAIAGTHIVFLDWAHQVDVEVNNDSSIRVHNGAGAWRDGNVTLIW